MIRALLGLLVAVAVALVLWLVAALPAQAAEERCYWAGRPQWTDEQTGLTCRADAATIASRPHGATLGLHQWVGARRGHVAMRCEHGEWVVDAVRCARAPRR